VLSLLVDLLSDPEKSARVGAVQALTYSGTEAAGLLLRLKARMGDEEPEVVCECFSGLLTLAPREGVPFVAEFLDGNDRAIQEGAVLALGSSRRAEAFEILKSYWERASSDLQEVTLMALALLRLPAANDFLLSLVANESATVAAAALAALAVHRYDPRICERAAAAVAEKKNATLQLAFDKHFQAKNS
jgi:hypothetical protein